MQSCPHEALGLLEGHVERAGDLGDELGQCTHDHHPPVRRPVLLVDYDSVQPIESEPAGPHVCGGAIAVPLLSFSKSRS